MGELREKDSRSIVTYENHVAELGKLREAALRKGSFSFCKRRNKSWKGSRIIHGRKIIKTGKLEDMSEQELEAKMKQLLNDYGQIIDVTPSKVSESSSPKPEESSSDPQN